jgi:6-phosphofructokinase
MNQSYHLELTLVQITNRRVNFVEVMGLDCGYLALMSSLATGAEKAYFTEQPINLDVLIKDLEEITDRFKEGGIKYAFPLTLPAILVT